MQNGEKMNLKQFMHMFYDKEITMTRDAWNSEIPTTKNESEEYDETL